MISLAVFGMCNWAYQWFDEQGRLSADEIAETYWRLLLNGIELQPRFLSRRPR
jgi:hypothetical protein